MRWLDAVKGLGIVAVVWGHVIVDPALRGWVYLWHMPLFFFLAGYVFKPATDLRRSVRERSLRLLVPYALFGILLSTQDLLKTADVDTGRAWAMFFATHLAGGKSVYGWLVAVWFVTCLYLTQLALDVALKHLSTRAMNALMAASLLLAYANAALFPRVFLPWAAHICLIAAPICYFGHLYRQHEAALPRWLPLLAALAGAVGLALIGLQAIAPFDMKSTRYGTPFASLAFALCIAVALIAGARRWLADGRLALVLATLGEASLVVMFLHMAAQEALRRQAGIEDSTLRIVFALAVSMLAYALLKRSALTRALFLGSVKDWDALRGRTAARHRDARVSASPARTEGQPQE